MDKKEYIIIHSWIRYRKKHIKFCSFCGSENNLDNALIRGKEHAKNVDNYIKLCRKCHHKYDYPDGRKHTENSKRLIGISSLKRIQEKGVSEIFKMSKKGTNISEEHKLKISNSISGEKHHQAKLKIPEVIEILKNKDLSNIELAKKYNVCKETISKIKTRKIWKKIKIE